MSNLDNPRWGAQVDLLPLTSATNAQGIVAGVDTAGQASKSPDIDRDWTVTIARSCGAGNQSIASRVLAIIEWSTGGIARKVELPLASCTSALMAPIVGAGGVVFHVVGTDVKVSFRAGVNGTVFAVPTVDSALVSVAPGRPLDSYCWDAIANINAGGAPAAIQSNLVVPLPAVEVVSYPFRDDVLTWPQPPVQLDWANGVIAVPAFFGAMPAPPIAFPVIHAMALWSMTMAAVPVGNSVVHFARWRLAS